ncbi:ArsR/SmtB family transcription factor [Parvularcula dongshanensis]|uniref:DNA-binding transcriptional ArsR family regulator n=1 Tax=Parvularcula dongshanensis TaxID=1173995 RepID=A0A840I6N9_9PROT|nr:metalloregulator ArsR/SmtB family transcription factor [Parvularcula dongshanensis]MBB4659921.1 DNA-binding transcriptional ArsR family regulator [Parvularcula dongshanensis]
MSSADTEKTVEQLSALAQTTRLAVFRMLVQAGPTGMAAGQIGERLGVAKNTLSSHLSVLQHAGLIGRRRDGRNLIYGVRIDEVAGLIRVLVQDCCGGHPEVCAPIRDLTPTD